MRRQFAANWDALSAPLEDPEHKSVWAPELQQ